MSAMSIEIYSFSGNLEILPDVAYPWRGNPCFFAKYYIHQLLTNMQTQTRKNIQKHGVLVQEKTTTAQTNAKTHSQ